MDSVKTNGYFNIRVENTSTKVLFQEDEQGDCSPTETVVSNQNKVLTYNGKLYEEASETGKTRQFLEFYPKKIERILGNMVITKSMTLLTYLRTVK